MHKRSIVVFACGLAALVAAAAAAASCVPMTPAEQRARATVIFDAIALDGPTPTGIERFKVIRYGKGRGPAIVRVQTGRKRFAGGGGVVTSVSISAAKGETWRIFARRVRPGVYETNVCDGSRRLRPRRR